MKNTIYIIIFAIVCIFIGGVLGFNLSLLKEKQFRRDLYRKGFGQREEDRFNFLANKLNLSEEQKTKLKKIFEDGRVEFKNLKEEFIKRTKQAREDLYRKIEEILTPQQQERFNKIKEGFKNRLDIKKNRLRRIDNL